MSTTASCRAGMGLVTLEHKFRTQKYILRNFVPYVTTANNTFLYNSDYTFLKVYFSLLHFYNNDDQR